MTPIPGSKYVATSSLEKAIERALEDICNLGCQSVWVVIDQLKRGEPVEQAAGLAAEQLPVLISELEAVMVVYEGSCTIPMKA